MNDKEKKALADLRTENQRLKEKLRQAEDEALRVRLGQINKANGFPDNTLGVP